MGEATIPDWISSISAAVGALAIVFGLFRANSKIDEFQANNRTLRRSEVAEELVALALNVEDAMKDIRNPFDSVPADKANDPQYGFQRRYERIASYNDLFQKLREASIRERALIGIKDVSEAVSTLFKARAEVASAIETLAREANSEPSSRSQEDREFWVSLRRVVYGRFSEKDALGTKISKAVEAIETSLRPFARMEAKE